MCLITKQEFPTILEEDLIVYKILNSDLRSLYYWPTFQYEYNQLYKTTIKVTDDIQWFDDKDFASIDIKNLVRLDFEDKIAEIKEHKYFCYGAGFHSSLTLNRFAEIENHIFKCVIPKGSEIYTNASGLVVSNKIIIKEKAN